MRLCTATQKQELYTIESPFFLLHNWIEVSINFQNFSKLQNMKLIGSNLKKWMWLLIEFQLNQSPNQKTG